MKRTITLFFALLLGLSVSALNQIVFDCHLNIDDKGMGNSIPKSPMQSPTVYIDKHTLTFSAGHPEYVLTITDENGDDVYTTIVTTADTQIVLPATLTGSYEIELTFGNWKFTGFISL